SAEETFWALSTSSHRSWAEACFSRSAILASSASMSVTCSMEDRVERSWGISAEKSMEATMRESTAEGWARASPDREGLVPRARSGRGRGMLRGRLEQPGAEVVAHFAQQLLAVLEGPAARSCARGE